MMRLIESYAHDWRGGGSDQGYVCIRCVKRISNVTEMPTADCVKHYESLHSGFSGGVVEV